MEEKEKLIDSDIQKVKSELEEIAKELGLPIKNIKVLREWNNRHPLQKGMLPEVYDNTIREIYFPPEENVHGIGRNENGECLVKRTRDSEWEVVIPE
jgi:hypothetical protein